MMMCGDGKESIRPMHTRPVIKECPVEPVQDKPDPLKLAIKEALGVHRS